MLLQNCTNFSRQLYPWHLIRFLQQTHLDQCFLNLPNTLSRHVIQVLADIDQLKMIENFQMQ